MSIVIADVKDPLQKLHYLNPVPIHDVYVRWIHKFERSRLEALQQLKTKLEENDKS